MLTTLRPPAREPFSIEEVAHFLNIVVPVATESPAEYLFLHGLIVSARQVCEQSLRRRLLTQTLCLTVDSLPDILRLPCGPVQTVERISRKLGDGSYVNLPQSIYCVSGTRIAAVSLWPHPEVPIGGFDVVYTAGFADAPEDLPPTLKAGLLQLIAYWHARKDDVPVPADSVTSLPYGVAALWHPFRMTTF
jgi:uncharacterized phiE125 gp8 family phage protein